MALTDVEVVRLLIGLTPANPFYDYMDDEEIQWFVDYHAGSVLRAARMAAISLALGFSSVNSREITGDIHVYNDVSRAYNQALQNFISDSNIASIPNGVMPYAAGISYADMQANNANSDNVRSPLVGIRLCDDNSFSYTNPFKIASFRTSCGC